MSLSGLNIVAIDDTAAIRTFLRISLVSHGVNFYEAASAQQGLELCQEVKPNLIVLDLGLPDIDGLTLLPQLRALDIGKETVIIVLTVRKEKETQQQALSTGADVYMTKPFLIDDLIEVIQEKTL